MKTSRSQTGSMVPSRVELSSIRWAYLISKLTLREQDQALCDLVRRVRQWREKGIGKHFERALSQAIDRCLAIEDILKGHP